MAQMLETNSLLSLWAKKKASPAGEVRYPLLFHMIGTFELAAEMAAEFNCASWGYLVGVV